MTIEDQARDFISVAREKVRHIDAMDAAGCHDEALGELDKLLHRISRWEGIVPYDMKRRLLEE
jgi:hypothetical protein